MIKEMSFLSRIILLSSGILMAILVFGGSSPASLNAAVGPGSADLPLEGWLWSSGLQGFISFCGGKNVTTTCPGPVPYQVIVNNTTGELRGHAWLGIGDASGNLVFGSYLSFNKTETGQPPGRPFNSGTSSFIARIDPDNPGTKQMEGWGRFLAACDQDINGNCTSSGPGTNSGGWDGWVRFSSGVAADGRSYPGFVATSTGTTGVLIGDAWGGEVVGWVEASTTGAFSPPPQVTLPSVKAVLTADPTGGKAPLTVQLTATVTTSSTLPITYSFDCDVNPGSVNIQESTFTSTNTTETFSCDYTEPGDYKPLVTVSQNGVFATANASSLVTNISGTGNNISVTRGTVIEIPVDE